MIETVLLIAGLIGLWLGADLVVVYSKRIASKLGISELFIGLTVVSIGTSLPEIAVSIASGSQIANGVNASGIIVGNVIGSILTNITLILGIAGLLAIIATDKKELSRDGSAMMIALLLLVFATIDGSVNYFEGIALIAIYLAYLYFISKSVGAIRVPARLTEFSKNNPLLDLAMILAGLIVIIFSSDWVVANAINVSESLDIDKIFVGLLIGLGTSLPELSVSVNAALKKSPMLSIGNLFGSNVTDPLLVLGLGAFFSKSIGVIVSQHDLLFTIPFALAATIIALAFMRTSLKLSKKEAAFLLATYIVFMGIEAWLFL